ncbi:MAG: MFS transporter [Candidatus Heimdallarchaeota archaeon]|nr:MFS transporter [Candidatus Heimdallarchaeota archaeon]
MQNQNYLPLRVVLPITSIGIVLGALDGSIVNVSLRTIANNLQASEAQVSWVVIAYLLTITSLMGLGGALGDVYGRKRIFQIGMFIFSIGSLFCSLSGTLIMLVISRIIQAIGASMIMSNGLAIVISFIDPRVRGRAIGINSLVVAASISAGPILGGIITEYFGWPYIFVINVPVGIFGLIVTQFKIPETEKRSFKPDYLGITLFGLAVVSLVYGIMQAFDGSILGIALIITSMISWILFYRQEAHYPNPMLSVDVLKSRQIMMGVISAIFAYMGINGVGFLLPFYLQDVLNFSQSKTGIFMIVTPVALSLVGPPAGFLAEKIKARTLATIGAICQTFGLVSLGTLLLIMGTQTPLYLIILFIGITAGFLSLFTNSNGTSVMNGTPKRMLSTVSGALNLSRNVGFTLGTALSSAIFFGLLLNVQEGDPNYSDAYHEGLGYIFLIFGAIVFIGAVLSFLRGEERLVLE